MRWRIIAAALALLVAGCSTLRLAYSQADTLLYWRLDDYADFTPAQAPAARDAIARWLDWHRRTQLPDYAALLDRAAIEVLQDTTPARACAWFGTLRERLDRAVDQALPAVAALAAEFEPRQLDHIAAKQAEVAAKTRRDYAQPDAAERLEASVERGIERAEQLYGRLGSTQREQIARGIAASPFDAPRWLAERERRQRDLLQVLRRVRAAPPPADAAGLLREHWRGVLQPTDAAYRRYLQQLEPYNCELAARVHNATTPAQRLTAQRKLQGWHADVLQLIAPQ